jgi:hypothetical protein
MVVAQHLPVDGQRLFIVRAGAGVVADHIEVIAERVA